MTAADQTAMPAPTSPWADAARSRYEHYRTLCSAYEQDGPLADYPVSLTIAERQCAELVPHLLTEIESLRGQLDKAADRPPPPVDIRAEWAAWCHGPDGDWIRLAGEKLPSRQAAEEWGRNKVGQYGITRYTVRRREHHVYPVGSRFAYAVTDWVEDTTPADRTGITEEQR